MQTCGGNLPRPLRDQRDDSTRGEAGELHLLKRWLASGMQFFQMGCFKSHVYCLRQHAGDRATRTNPFEISDIRSESAIINLS